MGPPLQYLRQLWANDRLKQWVNSAQLSNMLKDVVQ